MNKNESEELINNNKINNFVIKEQSGALYELKKDPKNMQEVIQLKLIKKIQVSHNSFVFTFELENKDMYLGLQLGQHIAIDVDLVSSEFPEGEPVCRKYTPISWIGLKGYVDILIKIYFKSEKFPEGGKFTQYISNLELGKTINCRGPFGKFRYLGDGNCQFLTKYFPLTYSNRKYNKIGMLAAGTGIAPIFQILQAADRNGESDVEFTLFYGNSTAKDILLRKELTQFVTNNKFKFKLVLMINNKEDNWEGEVGHFNQDNIKKYMPFPDDKTLIIHCGTRSLCRDVYTKYSLIIGHKKENIFEF